MRPYRLLPSALSPCAVLGLSTPDDGQTRHMVVALVAAVATDNRYPSKEDKSSYAATVDKRCGLLISIGINPLHDGREQVVVVARLRFSQEIVHFRLRHASAPHGKARAGQNGERVSIFADEIHMHDVVALLEDTPAQHFETAQSLVLRRGQIGTVVMTYDGTAFDVEFAGRDGRAYALLPISADRLMLLRDTPDYAAA